MFAGLTIDFAVEELLEGLQIAPDCIPITTKLHLHVTAEGQTRFRVDARQPDMPLLQAGLVMTTASKTPR